MRAVRVRVQRAVQAVLRDGGIKVEGVDESVPASVAKLHAPPSMPPQLPAPNTASLAAVAAIVGAMSGVFHELRQLLRVLLLAYAVEGHVPQGGYGIRAWFIARCQGIGGCFPRDRVITIGWSSVAPQSPLYRLVPPPFSPRVPRDTHRILATTGGRNVATRGHPATQIRGRHLRTREQCRENAVRQRTGTPFCVARVERHSPSGTNTGVCGAPLPRVHPATQRLGGPLFVTISPRWLQRGESDTCHTSRSVGRRLV